MRCGKCGFITHIKSDNCPYCGSEIKKNKLSDARVAVGKYFVSLKLFIPFVIFNLLWIMVATDFILFRTTGVNCHFSPWAMVVLLLPLLFFDCFVLTGKRKRRFFPKYMLAVNCVALMFSISYIAEEPFLFTGVKCYQFFFSYFIPVALLLAALTNCAGFLFRKRYNLLTSFFESLFLITYSTVLLILSRINESGIGYDLPSRIIIGVCFGVSFIMLVNSAVLSIAKMATKTIREEYNERHS